MSNSAREVGVPGQWQEMLLIQTEERSQNVPQRVLFADMNNYHNGNIDPSKYARYQGKARDWKVWNTDGDVHLKMQRYWRRLMGKREGSTMHWKPMTLQAPILGVLTMFSLLMIIVLEVLSYISSGRGNMNGGGVAFAPDVNSISTMTIFGYLYLPTILAVIYSMIWSWVDLDAKRIEPWFQLSRASGASAEKSLLIQYPFDFLPFIPFSAFHRRHWGVFFAGSIMLMVFWIITPLQSAIFNTGTILRSIPSSMTTTSLLIPLESQTSALNANFLNTAYGISWLKQALPAFSTAEFVFLPYHPKEIFTAIPTSEMWSTTVDAYSTNLTCNPANVSLSGLGYTFDNNRGCSVSEINFPGPGGVADYILMYIGYYDDPQVDWALASPNCPARFSNTFLAIWASANSHAGNGIYNNMTAQFCETSYHTQKMYVQVNTSTTQEISTGVPTITGSEDSSIENIFNITNFEYLLATGVTPIAQRANLQDDSVLEQFPRISSHGVAWPISNMVGFAIALNPLTVEDLVAPSALQAAFQNAHQLLFTTAFTTLLDTGSMSTLYTRDGFRKKTVGGILMVRSISIIVEIALGIISFFTVCLWYASYNHRSNLTRDPACIADVMSIIGRDSGQQSSLLLFRDDGTLTADRLAKTLSPHSFYLENVSDCGLQSSQLNSIETFQRHIGVETRCSTPSNKFENPVRPLELRLAIGVALIGVLILSLAALTFLGTFSMKHDGINLPTSDPLVLSILENYLPTAFSTFLEPVWVILNRLLCLLKPFDELREGNAKASASLKAKYASLPPQLALWRALKSRHFLLAAVCIVSFSSNILAVALSGLLFENTLTHILPLITSQTILPQFNGTAIFNQTSYVAPIQYYDHFYVAMSNFSENTTLPAWVDENFFYLPFELHTPPTKSVTGIPLNFQGFRGSTMAFGAESVCIPLSSNPSSNSVQFQPSTNDTSAQFSTAYTLSNGTTVTCFPHTADNEFNAATQFTSSPSEGLSALEVMHVMTPANGSSGSDFCGSIMVAGWVRMGPDTPEAANAGSNATFLGRSLNYTFLSCTQKLRIAPFDVLVDSEGHVITANQTGGFIEDINPYFSGESSENSLFQQSNNLIAPFLIDTFTWHNDSFTSDWLNVLLELVSNDSNALVNPAAPIPIAAEVAPRLQNMYQSLFAILLGLNMHVFSPAQSPVPMIGGIEVVESKIFVSRSMFVLSITILTSHLIVAILYYINRPKRFLPRMPTSIASIIAFVSASRALEDFAYEAKSERNVDRRYGYGRFIGADGQTHVGIEQQRYVIPLESRNPEIKRRKRTWKRQQDEGKEVKTWI